MKTMRTKLFGAMLFGAVAVVAAPGYAVQSRDGSLYARVELTANDLTRIDVILKDPEGNGHEAELTTFVKIMDIRPASVAAAAARMRPDLALSIFDAVAQAAPKDAVAIAAAIAGAVPNMRIALKGRMAQFVFTYSQDPELASRCTVDDKACPRDGGAGTETGLIASRAVPDLKEILRGTLEETIVVSPTI